ncbi:exodeoxyribonuclease VII large subunit [bacterium]|nr:exodeoxyribonuclease VII large subunit [bacterium]
MEKNLSPEEIKYVSVKDITKSIQQIIQSSPKLKNIWICGEVSNLIRHSSGHYYFTLKDSDAEIKVVIFKMYTRNINYRFSDGDKILIYGSVRIYPQRGQYQFYGFNVKPFGQGELYLRFLQTREKLKKLGYFDSDKKKKLPSMPASIGIITSISGAALHDILNVINKRYTIVDLYIVPAKVQGGEEASKSVVNAIKLLNEMQRKVDIIILARGGGSLEELWVFNTETVAEAIFKSEIPVLTGIGHEIDFSIADFTADLRAPTPSAAAEIAVPDRNNLILTINDKKMRLSSIVSNLVNCNSQHLDELKMCLINIIEKIFSEKKFKFSHLDDYIKRLPSIRMKNILEDRRLVNLYQNNLIRSMDNIIEKRRNLVSKLRKMLEILSPLGILDRGYCLAWDIDNGKLLRKRKDFKESGKFKLQVSDGEVIAVTEKKK